MEGDSIFLVLTPSVSQVLDPFCIGTAQDYKEHEDSPSGVLAR